MDFLSENRFKVGSILVFIAIYSYFFDLNNSVLKIIFYTVFFTEQVYMIHNFITKKDKNTSMPIFVIVAIVIFIYIVLGINALLIYNIIDKNKGILLITIVTTSDILQYYAGRYIGKYKVGFPSPNKTLEGYFVGIMTTIIIFHFMGYKSVYTVLCGVFGDLFVSFIKRIIGIKDVSRILGDHGGLLDRFDGIFMAAILSHC